MTMSAVEARFQPGSKWLWEGKEVTVVNLSYSGEFIHVDDGTSEHSIVTPDDLEPAIKPGDRVRVLPGAMYSMWARTPSAVQCTGREAEAESSPDFEGDVRVQGVGYVNVAYLEKVEEEPGFKVGDRVRVAEDAETPLGVPSSAAGTTSVIIDLEEDGVLLRNGGIPAFRYLTLVEDEESADGPEFKVGDRVRVAEDAKTPRGASSGAAGTMSVIVELEEDAALLENGGFPALRYLTLVEPDPLLTAEARAMLDMLEPNERLRLNECGVLTREELRAYYFLSN